MFVCLCHSVTDSDINQAIENGAESVAELMRELKVATQCGSCLDDVSALVSQQQNSASLAVQKSISKQQVGIYRP